MARSSDEFLPRLLWPSTEMLQKSKGNFSARPPSSFSGSPREVRGPDGTSAGAPTATSGPGRVPNLTPDLPKQPEMPRGILGVTSAPGVRRTFSTPAPANATPPAAAAAMGPQRRVAQASPSRPPQQHAFPVITPSAGASQRKKKWRPHCQQPTCLRPASYAETSDADPVFCEKHKTASQQNVVHPNRGDCEFEGCGRVSAYASTADTRARFCHSHKEDGMVKVRDNVGTRCEEATCIKQASFAMEGDRYPKFCKDHRQEDMINIRNHRCIAPGCSRGASFAVSGSRGQYCSEHKAAGMINTRRRNRCIAPGCTSREPIYVVEGQHLPKFCANHKGPGMSLPYTTSAPRGECVLPGCDRAVELAGPGEGQQRLCAAHSMESQQQGPARRPSMDEASPARPGGSFTAPNPAGSTCSDTSILAHSHRRDKTEAEAGQAILPVKKEMMVLSSGSSGSNGGATPGQLERMAEPPGGQMGGVTALDFHRHGAPPRSPEAALGSGGTSALATSPSPTAAWRMASPGGRGGGSIEVLGREKQEQAPAARARAAAAAPPHVYQALRPVGGATGDPEAAAAAAAAAVWGAGMSRPSTPSTTVADGDVIRRGSGRDDAIDSGIAMGGEGGGKGRASGSFGSAFPGRSNIITGASGAHLGFRVPREHEYYTDSRPSARSPSRSPPGQGIVRHRSAGRRQQHRAPAPEQELEQVRRRPVVRLLHMDDPTGTACLPPSISVLPTPPSSPEPEGGGRAEPTTPARGGVNKGVGITRREHGVATAGGEAAAAAREGKGGGAALELRPPHRGGIGIGIGIEGGSATDSTMDATAMDTTEDEGDDETKETSAPLAADNHAAAAAAAVPENETRRAKPRRQPTPPSAADSLKDTHPPGYSPTPFYFTLVKALTATGTGKGNGAGKRKRVAK